MSRGLAHGSAIGPRREHLASKSRFVTEESPTRIPRGPFTAQHAPTCPNCLHAMGDLRIVFEYYAGTLPVCPNCKKPFDWLDLLTRLMEEGDAFYQALGPAGARWTVTVITLQPGQNYHLDLTQHDIPADARVLSITYTPRGGGLHGLEWHGNMPDRKPHIKTILVPVEIIPPPVGPTDIAVLVTWVPGNLAAEPWAEFCKSS